MLHSVDDLQHLLTDNGFEIYAVHGRRIHIAERIRVHLMDSGVSVACENPLQLTFTVRSERSSAPDLSDDQHFDRVRSAIAGNATAAGYDEAGVRRSQIEDPGDPDQTLDVWFEVQFGKTVEPAALADEIGYCLRQPRSVA